jgi:hypothetical protein
MMGRRLVVQGMMVACLASVLWNVLSGGLPALQWAAAQQAPAQAGMAPPAVPTPVIAGLRAPLAHGYLDALGRYHSALAPYWVRSHWPATEVGGTESVERNDRFMASGEQRYIDVIAVPNPRRVDTARAERLLWDYLSTTGMQPHIIGRLRVLGAWVRIVGLTNLDTGQPHARIVFATAQHVWLMDLATWPRALSGDVHELVYMAGTFHLDGPPATLTAPGRA